MGALAERDWESSIDACNFESIRMLRNRAVIETLFVSVFGVGPPVGHFVSCSTIRPFNVPLSTRECRIRQGLAIAHAHTVVVVSTVSARTIGMVFYRERLRLPQKQKALRAWRHVVK